jgi:hypothetical protein
MAAIMAAGEMKNRRQNASMAKMAASAKRRNQRKSENLAKAKEKGGVINGENGEEMKRNGGGIGGRWRRKNRIMKAEWRSGVRRGGRNGESENEGEMAKMAKNQLMKNRKK